MVDGGGGGSSNICSSSSRVRGSGNILLITNVSYVLILLTPCITFILAIFSTNPLKKSSIS